MAEEEYEIFRKALDSPGMQFVNRMKAHSFSLNIFQGNLIEIKKAISIIENPEIGTKLMSQENREIGDQAHREINRLFHNFLASAKTLIEHTRIFIDTYYSKTPIDQAYSAKIRTEYSEDPLCRFIQDLRNYILHKGLPDNTMSLTYNVSKRSIKTTVSLNKDSLLEWQKWNIKSRYYLNSQDKNIQISSLTETYGNKIGHLYEWLSEKLHKHHSKDLSELKRIQNKFSDLTNNKFTS